MQLIEMRGVLLTASSAVLTAGVIGNAYLQKRQFYPSVVYLTKSNPSLAVIYVQALVLVILIAKVVRKLFFGQLRASEQEHLIERSWYAVTETCLAFTVFRDDFSPKFVALFTLLLFLKSFHWLIEDRVDFIERSPVISLLFHIRVISLMSILAFLDYCFFSHAYYSTLTRGASVQLVFGFEYVILLTILVNIFIKYLLHTIDLQSEMPWENKAVYLLYTELIIGFVKVVLYFAFMSIMIKMHTLPLFTIRPMYLALRAFKKAFNDVIMSRRAIRNMNTLYPNATTEDLLSTDNVCIICREEMLSVNSKKLPCSHIFHTSCLRSWFQRQQTCPTCRMDIVRIVLPRRERPQQQQQQQQPPQQQQQQQPGAQQIPNLGGVLFGGGFQGPFPLWPHQVQQPQQPAAPPNSNDAMQSNVTSSSTGTTTTPSAGTVPSLPPFLPPPFFPFMFPPPPMPPTNFTGLTDEEIRQMEGQERENVEARIQSLRNIQILLDAAVIQMQQYSALVSSLRSSQGQQPSSTSQSSPSNTTTTSSISSLSSISSTQVSATNVNNDNNSSISSSTNRQQSYENSGAKPKVFCPEPKPFTTNMSSAPSTMSESVSDGASGFSSDAKNTENNEQAEIRKRRLERFGNSLKTDQADNLDLD